MTDAQAKAEAKRQATIARIAKHAGVTVDEVNAQYPAPNRNPAPAQTQPLPLNSSAGSPTNPFSAALVTIGVITLLTGVILLISGGVVANQDDTTIGERFADIATGFALLQWGAVAACIGVTALLVMIGVAAVRWTPKPAAAPAAPGSSTPGYLDTDGL